MDSISSEHLLYERGDLPTDTLYDALRTTLCDFRCLPYDFKDEIKIPEFATVAKLEVWRSHEIKKCIEGHHAEEDLVLLIERSHPKEARNLARSFGLRLADYKK